MRNIVYLLMAVFIPCFANAQAGEWVWVKGADTTNSPGNYGTMGVPSVTNEPSGMYAAATWTDTAGNFWFYGGSTYNDSTYYMSAMLWRFNPDSLQWTWMNGDSTASAAAVFSGTSGVFSDTNQPGALGFCMSTWVDKQNHLWMYGGSNGIGTSGTLWQYDPAINQWAWMYVADVTPVYGTEYVPNSINSPGERAETTASWTDSLGNLWLFGGYDADDEDLSDMWEYKTDTGLWVWMGGSSAAENYGNYGPIGSASQNYYPSARCPSFSWQDGEGNFWVAEGMDLISNDIYDDVWKFNPYNYKWTLVHGSENPDSMNVSAGNCVMNSTNNQGGRWENSATWKMCNNVIFNYGGLEYYNGYFTSDTRNDLWAYLIQQNEWVEINKGPALGNYGTQNVSSAQNYPPARIGSGAFTDKHNNLWLFGGGNFDEAYENDAIYYNDLWKYVPDSACLGNAGCASPVSCNLGRQHITAATDTICPGDSAQICAPAGFSTYTWNTGDTTTCMEAKTQRNYYVAVTDSNGCTAQSDTISIAVYQTQPVTITANKTIICMGDSAQVCAPVGYNSYLWNDLATTVCIETQNPGDYDATVTGNNGCKVTSNYIAINMYPSTLLLVVKGGADTICPYDTIGVCVASHGFTHYLWNNGDTTRCIEVDTSGLYYVTVIDTNGCAEMSNPGDSYIFIPQPVNIFTQGDTLMVNNVTVINWYLNGTALSGATSNFIALNGAGSYTAEVTDTSGCTYLTPPFVYTGISNITCGDNISIYPNPLSVGNWQLAVGNEYIGAQVEILDADGRVVYKLQITKTKSQINAPVEGGVYLLRIISGETVIAKKLVKL